MVRFVSRRALLLLPAFLFASLVIFAIVHLVPGDPVDLLVGPNTPAERRAELIDRYGLDQPLPVQYWNWMSGVVSGDLGESIVTRRPVADIVAEVLPHTLRLGTTSLLLSMLLGIGLGMLAASYRDTRIDRAAMALALLGITIPSFWLGLMLMLVFSVHLAWFPVSGVTAAGSLVLPATTLALAGAGLAARVTRASLIDTLTKGFVLVLHARGLPPSRIFFRHVLRNALVPVITIFGLRIGWILGGAVTVETVFGRPGIGTLLVQGIARRDYPVIQAALLCLAVAVMLSSLLSDALHGWVDPRVREKQR